MMAKAKAGGARRREKARLELRVDQDLLEAVQALAMKADVSVNQLVGGITRTVIAIAHVGRVEQDEGGAIDVADEEPGRLWFGWPSEVYDGPDGKPEFYRGTVWFALDFSDERALVPAPRAIGHERAKKGRRS